MCGIADTRTLTANSLVMVGTNVVLNYILIFRETGFSCFRNCRGSDCFRPCRSHVVALFYRIHRLEDRPAEISSLPFPPHRNPLTQTDFGYLDLDNGAGIYFYQHLVFIFIAVEHLGERPLAITNVLRNISSLFFIIVSAFATTASSLVSNLMGSGDSGRVMDTFKKVSRLCYVFILPLIFVMALFPNSVMRIYTDNSALIQSAVPAYYVMIFVYLVSVPANILFNTVSGTGNTRSALFIELIALVAYVLSVIYLVIYLKADVAICWTTEYIYLVCMFSLTYWYMKKGNWKNKKI